MFFLFHIQSKMSHHRELSTSMLCKNKTIEICIAMTFVCLQKLVYKRVVRTFSILLPTKQGIVVNILLTMYNTVSKGSDNIFNSTSDQARDSTQHKSSLSRSSSNKKQEIRICQNNSNPMLIQHIFVS